jgi:Type IV pili methyl-accepting chemotaxis transducer N-term/His Kinase A (phospho-acceptor) domain
LSLNTTSLWPRYIIALVLIACTSITVFGVSRWASSTAESYSAAINIAGRQRMLSQRIAYFVVRIDPSREKSEQAGEMASLETSISEFETAHNKLTRGEVGPNGFGPLPKSIQDLYFGLPGGETGTRSNLNGQSLAFIADARSALTQKGRAFEAAKMRIEATAPDELLSDLNKVVVLWEKTANEAAQRSRKIEATALVATLALLFLEAIFIFWPIHKAMEQALAQAHTERDRAISAHGAAELAAQARIAFLEKMTHELRTPLTAIIGRSEIMQEDIGDLVCSNSNYKSLSTDTSKIISEAHGLLKMIGDITNDAIEQSGGKRF